MSAIPIKNLYFILSYAWGLLDESDHLFKTPDLINTPQDLLTAILINGTTKVIKDGLNQSYVNQYEIDSQFKGKIDFTGSTKRLLFEQGKVAHYTDDLTHNILMNQILKSVLFKLNLSNDIDLKIKPQLKLLLKKLNSIDYIKLDASIFKRVQINQNNSIYKFLMNVCELIHNNLFVNESNGDMKFIDFTRDEIRMRKVFQTFVFNFYRLNQSEYRTNAEKFGWIGATEENSNYALLPKMNTDISLTSSNRKIILDTKYYSRAFNEHFGKEMVRSEHLYQIFAYVKNSPTTLNQIVEGILVYPTTSSDFNLSFTLHNHQIKACSVNLDVSWKDISIRLLNIINPKPNVSNRSVQL